MASRRRSFRNVPPAVLTDARPDGEPALVVRRAPFADNPHVGARGQRTQQRILDAALEAFGEGYERCSIDAITQRAGCSRAAFYQYFSSKEDIFRHLTGQVALQLAASTEALEPLRPDEAGWRSLRAWVSRQSDIQRRYEPLFHAVQEASKSDHAVATGSARWGVRIISRIRSRLVSTSLRPREIDPLIMQLLECVTRTFDIARILRSAGAEQYLEDRVVDALTDVFHRSLFGLQAGVNVHLPPPQRPPDVHFDRPSADAFTRVEPLRELTPAGRRTREALMEAGRKVFVERGYHRARISDVVETAGMSRGAFYRYFEDKDRLARTLATRAMQTVAVVLAEIPDPTSDGGASGRTALRRWLRRYNLTQADQAAMLRVWVDAALQDASMRADSAPPLDWGRRVLASFLEPRGFGDVDTEGLVMLALLASFGARERAPAEVDAAAHIVEQGLLGRSRR